MTNSVAKRLLKLKFLLFTGHVSHILDPYLPSSSYAPTAVRTNHLIFCRVTPVLPPFDVSYSLPKRSAKVSA
jgi:hypothetical protein